MISLDKIDAVNVFKVPDGYFDALPLAINQRIRFEEKPNFQVPENYFDGLSSKILNRIDQIERKTISLDNLEKVNVFQVPQGYFEYLSKEILSKTEQKTKTIQINWFSSRVKWSAAASIILMIGLWFGVPQFTKNKTELALEKVSNEEIKIYLETQDLSYLEYESAVENVKNSAKTIDSKALEGLQIEKQEILEHLENQDLEEDI